MPDLIQKAVTEYEKAKAEGNLKVADRILVDTVFTHAVIPEPDEDFKAVLVRFNYRGLYYYVTAYVVDPYECREGFHRVAADWVAEELADEGAGCGFEDTDYILQHLHPVLETQGQTGNWAKHHNGWVAEKGGNKMVEEVKAALKQALGPVEKLIDSNYGSDLEAVNISFDEDHKQWVAVLVTDQAETQVVKL